MRKAPVNRKRPIKSQRLQNTKRSSASTLTSRGSRQASREQKKSRSASRTAFIKNHEAVVDGISMWPCLKPGYKISFQPVNPESLTVGDLIVLRSRGRRGEEHFRVHRLIGRAGPFFVECGDNAYVATLVRPQDILGLVQKVKNEKAKKIPIQPASKSTERRFRFFLSCAHAFMFVHECKDRALGNIRSPLLWRISEIYRGALGVAGLRVPAIPPMN